MIEQKSFNSDTNFVGSGEDVWQRSISYMATTDQNN